MSKLTRRIVAVALAATMVLTSMASAVFANDNSAEYVKSAEALQGYGVFVGDNGNLMLDQQLKRQDAVVIALRLMGHQDEEFTSYERVSDFTDINDEYYMPIIGMAQDLGLVEGMGDGTFGFDQKVTAQQLETILLRALGYEITDDIYAEVPQMAEELGLSNLVSVAANEEITRDIVAQLMLNTLNTNVKDGETKLGEELGFFESNAAPLEVKEAKVATDSSVQVTFNRAVVDTSKLVFELKGTTVVETQATWSADKTVATLTAPSTLLAGAYTLKVSGETFAAGKDTASLNVVANGPAKIELAGDKLVKAAGNTATLRFRVLDTYGVDITKNVNAADLTIASSKTLAGAPTFTLDANNVGVMTVNFAAPLDLINEKTVAMTIIANKTAASVNATLNTAAAAQADEVTLGQVTFPTTTPATTKILTANATAAYIPVALKDQYGSAIIDKNVLGANDLLLVKSDSRLTLTLENYTDANNNKGIRIVVDTTGINAAAAVSVNAVTTLAGKSSAIALNIQEPAKPDKVSVGSQTASVIAEADAAETFVLPITALDQYGVQLTNDEIASNVAKFTVNGNGMTVGIATSGVNKGKLVNTAAIPAKGTYVITISTGTSVATYTVSVSDKAYEKTIKLDKAPAANLLMGATANMNYKFIDQYGREIKSPNGATKVTLETGATNILKVNNAVVNPVAEITNAAAVAGSNLVAVTTNGNAGNDSVTAKLFDSNNNVISTVSTSFNVVSGVPGTLTFSVNDLQTIAALYDEDQGVPVNGFDLTTNANYAGVLNLVAKDANGITYAIPASRILNVTTSNAWLVAEKTDGTPAITAQQNAIVVHALASAFAGEQASVTTKTGTITILVSTDNGPVAITKDVTVAKAAAKVVKVVFADKALDAANPLALPTDAKEITAISGLTADINAQLLYVYTVDQYGVYTAVGAPAFTVVNPDRFNGAMGYAANKLVFAANKIKANQNVYLMYQAANGVYGTFSINASDGSF